MTMSLSLEMQTPSPWGLSTELPVLDLPLTSAKHRCCLTPHGAAAMGVTSWGIPSAVQPAHSAISQMHMDQTVPSCS